MFTVVLIGTVALVIAIVGCFFIWRFDASRAEEVERTSPPPTRPAPGLAASTNQPKHLGS